MNFSFPVSFVAPPVDNYFLVEFPVYGFVKKISAVSGNIEFSLNTSKLPQKIVLSYHTCNNDNCVVHQPQIWYEDLVGVPVRTISLTKNRQEVSLPISGLNENYNYRSWTDVCMVDQDILEYRYHWDYGYYRIMQL